MTGAAPPVDFQSLRDAAIAHAQQASAEIWTDYNLHDPGVTLIEQTCFALTELAYRAGLPVRDLLTAPDGRLGGAVPAFAGPARVLSHAPVTRADLVAELATAWGVARVTLSDTAGPGLLVARIVPTDSVDAIAAAESLRAHFARNRPLCTDLSRVETAAPVFAVVAGEVTIAPHADPEDVAAAIFGAMAEVTRAQADGPDDPEARAADLIAAVQLLPDVLEVTRLSLAAPDGAPVSPQAGSRADSYITLRLPVSQAEQHLDLVQNGRIMALDLTEFRQALVQLRARRPVEDTRSTPEDANALRPGRRRRFDLASVNATLPALYPASGARAGRSDGAADRQLAGYRAITDALLGALTADLARLPDLFSADPGQAAGHWASVPEIARRHGLVTDGVAFETAGASDEAGPARRRAVLDLVIALHGDALHDGPHTGVGRYIAAPGRAQAALDRRARLIAVLPTANRRRAIGPQGADPGGMMARLLAHLDLVETDPCAGIDALRGAGLDIGPVASEDLPTIGRDDLGAPDDPLDLLAEVIDAGVPGDPTDLFARTPALAVGTVTPGMMSALSDPEAYLTAPTETGWHLAVDPGGAAELVDCGEYATRQVAVFHANRLRAALCDRLRAAEYATLVEDILLRGDGTAFAANTLTLVLPGWTPRTRDTGFRRHAERCAAAMVPAQCHLRVAWLDLDESATFAGLWAAWRADTGEGPALRAFLAGRRRTP